MATPAMAFTPAKPWPPANGPGVLFVHYGEEHWNDADGETLLPKIVEVAAKYEPKLVTMSGDKDNDGETDQLEKWREIMSAYDDAGVPYYAGVGQPRPRRAARRAPGRAAAGQPRALPRGLQAAPLPDGRRAGLRRSEALAARAPGRRSRRRCQPLLRRLRRRALDLHRQLVLADHRLRHASSCRRRRRSPARGSSTSSSASPRRARTPGKVVFVVMHMPTQDPGDQSYRDTIARMHTMGKGASPDNGTFESIAAQTGVDGVFVGHIKGQFLYRGRGRRPVLHRRRRRRRALHRRAGRRRPWVLARLPPGARGRRADRDGHGPDLRQGRHPDRGPGQRRAREGPPARGVRQAAGLQRSREGRGARAARSRSAVVVEPPLELGLVVRALARATGRDLPAARARDRRHAPPPRALRRDPGVARGARGVRRRRGRAAERADLDAEGEPADTGPDLDLEQPERPGTGRIEGRRPAPRTRRRRPTPGPSRRSVRGARGFRSPPAGRRSASGSSRRARPARSCAASRPAGRRASSSRSPPRSRCG